MYKVKDKVLRYFYKEDMTGCDQLTYKALINMCDERGVVNGCYYKEIINICGYSEGQFYRSLSSLENRELIIITDNGVEKTVIITGNEFNNYEIHNNYCDYCDLNIELYESDKYRTLRAGARRILEYIVFRVLKQKYQTVQNSREEKKKKGEVVKDNNLNSLLYSIDKKTLKSEIHMYSKIQNEVFGKDGLTYRMFKSYIKELKEAGFISVGFGVDINDKRFDVITLSSVMIKTPTIEAVERGSIISNKKRNSKHSHFVHYVRHLCRMFKLSFNELNLTNVALLLVQYKNKVFEAKKNLYAVFKTAISTFSKDNVELDSKIVHSITKKIISKDYTNSLLVY